MTAHGVILFHTTSSAMRAESLLGKASFRVKLVPTPREFSSDCGLALRFDWDDHEQVKSTLDAGRVGVAAIHRL